MRKGEGNKEARYVFLGTKQKSATPFAVRKRVAGGRVIGYLLLVIEKSGKLNLPPKADPPPAETTGSRGAVKKDKHIIVYIGININFLSYMLCMR